jgi:hypothetical protein
VQLSCFFEDLIKLLRELLRHVARMEEKRKACRSLFRKPEVKITWET